MKANEKEQVVNDRNPWERVFRNIELDADKYVGEKDVSRMRASMIARKNDLDKK